MVLIEPKVRDGLWDTEYSLSFINESKYWEPTPTDYSVLTLDREVLRKLVLDGKKVEGWYRVVE